MAARELVTVVIFDGSIYGPGYINPPPDDVAERITNPAAWGDEKSDTDDEPPQGGQTEEPGAPSAPPAPPAPVAPAPAPVEAPPRSGAGSGIEAWRAFANARKVSYPADAKREDIIQACEDAKVI